MRELRPLLKVWGRCSQAWLQKGHPGLHQKQMAMDAKRVVLMRRAWRRKAYSRSVD